MLPRVPQPPSCDVRCLLVIEGHDPSGDSFICHALDREPSVRCTRVTWRDLHPETLSLRRADAIVANLVDDNAAAAELLSGLCVRAGATPVVAVLGADCDEQTMAMARDLADDFVVAPVRALELRNRLVRLIPTASRDDAASLSDRLAESLTLARLVGRDPAFLRAVEQIPRFAQSEASVLITGETGTGKEVCARALHQLSRRRDGPFIAVDCAAVPDQLFENEFFGHARGAFTDAHRDRKGLVAMADGGTLFLDEVDSLSLGAQAKLLRFVQEHSYRPLGAERVDRVSVKVLAATNRDLDAAVRDRQMRADLYFRINVLRIHLPPLRDRAGDIPRLAHALLDESRGALESSPSSFSAAAMRVLTSYGWPGNVRELSNVVQRAAVACDGAVILPVHLTFGGQDAAETSDAGDFRSAKAAAVEAFERQYVQTMLEKHGGNVTHAAREAHQDRRAFGRFIRKYHLKRSTA
jgi:DNA-binding NtrC family response regulator